MQSEGTISPYRQNKLLTIIVLIHNHLKTNKKNGKPTRDFPIYSAEGEGFKPPIPGKGIPDFESSAFGHSANLPIFQMKMIDIYFSSLSKSNAKVII